MRVSLITGLASLALSLLCSTVGASPLPNLGGAEELSPAQERRLGDSIGRSLLNDAEVLEDPVIEEYLQSVFDRLLQAARERGDLPPELDEHMAWRIVVLKNPSLNAFALPGGYFGVHLGLLARLTTEDELAAVLAHELSHLTQRHIARRLAAQDNAAPWTTAAMVMGVLAAAKSPQAANAVLAGGQAAALSQQLAFSRDMEREADRMGFGVLTQANYNGSGFVGMFSKLENANRFSAEAPSPYLKTHPLTTERKADMATRITSAHEHPSTQDALLRTAFIAARAQVLLNPGPERLRDLVAKAQPDTEAGVVTNPNLYAASFAAFKLRQPALGSKFLLSLNDRVRMAGDLPWSARYVRLLALEQQPEFSNAMNAVRADDKSRAQLILLAEQEVRHALPPQTAPALQDWARSHPADALAWETYASQLQATAKPLDAIFAQAQYFAAVLDYGRALDTLRSWQEQALTVAHTPADEQIVEARIKELTALLSD